MIILYILIQFYRMKAKEKILKQIMIHLILAHIQVYMHFGVKL